MTICPPSSGYRSCPISPSTDGRASAPPIGSSRHSTSTPGSRPLAWIDDSLDPSCYEWADERPTPTLLVPTEPDVGLLDLHVEALEGWVAAGFQPA